MKPFQKQSQAWELQNSYRDVKSSIGNTVNNIVITVYGVRWVLKISGEPFLKYMII